VHGRRRDEHLLIPGWPYSMVAALDEGRTSWTRLLDARRLLSDDDEAAVTAAQVRDVVLRIIGAGHWQPGDAGILLVFDAGYDLARLSFLLGDLPVQVLGRLRSDRVMGRTPPPRLPGTSRRPVRHAGQRGRNHDPCSVDWQLRGSASCRPARTQPTYSAHGRTGS
jgi:DDE superfamily endonuclease